MAELESSLVSSLNKLSEFSSTGNGVAKVKQRVPVKEDNWGKKESAGGLLAGLLDASEEEAWEELNLKEAELKAQEEARKEAERAEEEAKKAEAEAKLSEEQDRLKNAKKRRTQMLLAIEREKKIEAGEIDLEEEARLQREEEERKRKEEEERLAREAELAAKEALIEQQNEKIRELAERPLNMDMQRSRVGVGTIAAIVLVCMLVFGGGAYWFVMNQSKDVDIYALADSYPVMNLAVETPQAGIFEAQSKKVEQEAPKKTAPAGSGRSGGKKPVNKFGNIGGTKGTDVLNTGKGAGLKF